MRRVLIAFSVVALIVPLVSAGVPGAKKLAEAEKLAAAGKFVEAATIYGKELASAQKKKDLAWQGRLARSMRDHMEMQESAGAREHADYAATLRAVMMALDPRKNFAFCSAGQLSHALLFDATLNADYSHVEEAAAVCVQHAKIKNVGLFAPAMADYAAGLQAVAAEDYANAIPLLEAAFEVTARECWAWPSIHLATEIAAAHVKLAQDEEAAAALTRAGAVMKESDILATTVRLRHLVTTRLRGASEKIKGAFAAAIAPFPRVGLKGAGGGAARSAPSPDGNDVSKVGRAFHRLSAGKPFVTVKRTGGAYEIRQSFDRRFKASQPLKDGVKNHTEGGISLGFWDGGVKLQMVDLTGLQGRPEEAADPGTFLFFDPLPRGYIWGVTKTGIVTQIEDR